MSKYKFKFGLEIEGTSPLSQSEILDIFTRNGITAVIQGRTMTSLSPDCWVITTDRSIQDLKSGKRLGDEFVSPIMVLDSDGNIPQDYIKRVCAVIKECQLDINKSCALHVHVNAVNYPIESIKRLFELYKRVEPELNLMFPRSRRENMSRNGKSYCAPLSEISFDDFVHQERETGQLKDTKYHSVRMSKHVPTIEFRSHGATTNANKICMWIKIVKQFIFYCLSDSYKSNISLEALLGEHLYKYYLKRVEELG